MPKVLNIIQRGTPSENWSTVDAFNEKDIKNIKDPSGMTDKKQITSIPSPFARIDLFKTAFGALVDQATGNLDALDGNSIHHKLVSDCLDMVQIFFEWDTFSESVDKNLKIITWNKRENLEKLKNSGNSAHRLLGETLELFFEQDRETYNFDDLEDFFLVEYDYKVIGGTSPVTLGFTTANDLSHVNLGVGEDKFFDTDYYPLYKREREFQKFLHLLFQKVHEDLRTEMKEFFKYLELSLNRLGDTDPGLRDEINQAVRNFKKEDFFEQFPVLNTGKAGQNIYILGMEMRKKKVNRGAVSNESDFVIKSDKWDTKYSGVPDTHKPLVLQNEYSKRRMSYTGGGYWERNTPVPYSYGNTPLEKRKLPGQNMVYPHLTVDDFLEPYLIKLVYPLNNKFYDGNMVGFKQDHVGFLLPLKKDYFDYFNVDDLKRTTIEGDKMIELSDRAGGGVMVTLRIPITKNGEYITLERMYYPNTQPEISATQNKGAIVECQFSMAIFPFIKLDVSNHYRVVLIDRDIKETNIHYDYKLHFYNQKDISKFIENPYKERSQKLRDNVTSRFYMLDDEFDLIEVNNGTAKGLLIPAFPHYTKGTNKFTFAVDFGTTNSHIEYKIDGQPLPFEITEEDVQYVTTYPGNYNMRRFLELSLTILREFLPSYISSSSKYNFPFRTSISEHSTLNHRQPVDVLADMNIPFYYEKLEPETTTKIFKEIKWSKFSAEDASRNRVEKFIENLLFMMRNKVILNGGSLNETELIWFFPSSMTPNQQDSLGKIWIEKFEEYFPEVEDANEKIIKMSESLAPFHYYNEYEEVDSLAYPVVNIDIGGGTTDIVVFYENEAKFLSSFKFAGNAIFGDGYNSSQRNNGFVKRYKSKVKEILSQNEKWQLISLLDGLKNEKSQEVISFFFSLDNNQTLKEDGIQVGFSKMLAEDQDLKIVFMVFYGAILYHVAKMMKKAGLMMPLYICFSGNGSRSLNLIDSSHNQKRISKLAMLLFEAVYNDKEEETPYKYGKGIQEDDLEIKQVSNPKEVTCKGGIIGEKSGEIDDIKMVMLGTREDKVVNSKIENVPSENMKYADLKNNNEVLASVMDEVKHFVDLFFDLDDEYSFSRNFGVNVANIDHYKEILTSKLLVYLKKGIDEKQRKDLDKNLKAKVEETLFFYPLIGSLNKLASGVV